MKLLITGGAGFIGSNFIRYWLNNHPEDKVVNLDALTYAGNLASLADVADNPNYEFFKGDITDVEFINRLVADCQPDCIVNFAAESHNSWAVIDPGKFFRANVIGAQTLLEAARKNKVPRFHHISTCEVYGDLALDSSEKFTEQSPYRPRTPYNASKAGADLAARVYFDTFKLPATISNCCNNYGPYQFPEKLIPLFVTNLLDNKKVPLYKQSQNKREWLSVLDHCRAIDLILQKGRIGETYNVGSGVEKSVEEITAVILNELGLDESRKEYVEDRPGHDRRYLLDSSKIRNELGWQAEIDFTDGMKETIQWYKANRAWWQPLQDRVLDETKW